MIEKGTIIAEIRLHGKKSKDCKNLVTATAESKPLVEAMKGPISEAMAITHTAFSIAFETFSRLSGPEKVATWGAFRDEWAALRTSASEYLIEAGEFDEFGGPITPEDLRVMEQFSKGPYDNPVCNALDMILGMAERSIDDSREMILDKFSDRWQALVASISPEDN